MRGSDYLLQEIKMKAFFTFGNRCRERIVQRFNPGVIATRLTGLISTPGLKVLHVIGEQLQLAICIVVSKHIYACY